MALRIQIKLKNFASIAAQIGLVIAVGAHTSGHIAIHVPDEKVVFTGDTLFAMGCGRLFEGSGLTKRSKAGAASAASSPRRR